MHRARYLTAVVLACICLPATAHATQSVSLNATLIPERLGQGTTIGFGFKVTAPAGQVPSPLTELDLLFPGDLGIAVSGLGLDTCSPATLEAWGPTGCPVDSLMGYGSALAEIPFGSQIIQENAAITIVRAPTKNGHLAFLIHATEANPVIGKMVFPALLFPSPSPFGERLHVSVPLIPSLPDAPNIALVRLHATLGPQGIIYNERVGDKVITYRPNGILLPDRCPRGGFPFAATFSFLDSTRAHAHTTVPCPATHRAGVRSSHVSTTPSSSPMRSSCDPSRMTRLSTLRRVRPSWDANCGHP